MIDFFIFSTIILFVSILSYYRYRKKIKIVSTTTRYYFAKEKVVPKEKRIRYYNNVIFIMNYFSILCDIILLLTFIRYGSKLLIFIAICYLIINLLFIGLSLYKLYEKKIKSFYYDINNAVERILNSEATDNKNNIDYPRRAEINKLLDEVVEETNNSEDIPSKKINKRVDKKAVKKEMKKTNNSKDKLISNISDPKRGDIVVSIIDGKPDKDEKEIKRKEKNLEYKKEQEEIDEILAFLDAKGL